MTDNQLDKLLQEGLKDMEVPAPEGAWEAIRNGIQATPPAPAPASDPGLMATIQQWSIGAKIAAAIAVPAVATTLYFSLAPNKQSDPKPEVRQEQKIEAEAQSSAISESEMPAVEIKAEKKAAGKSGQPSGMRIEQTPEPVHGTSVESPEPTHSITPVTKVEPGTQDLKANNDHSAPAEKSPAEKTTPPQHINEPATPPAISYQRPELGNAFSPNGDGSNDVWEIRMEKPALFQLRIYDTRGQQVFETDSYQNYWNGLHYKSGQECDPGQYAYILVYQYEKTEKVRTLTGFVNLIR